MLQSSTQYTEKVMNNKPMLMVEGITLDLKGKAHILESELLQETRLAQSPEATILNPSPPDIF